MRKFLLCLCAALLIAAAASAQDKVDSALKCDKPTAQHSIDVGDKPVHAYSISHFTCTFTKGEIGGVKDKDGAGTQFDEVTADSSRYIGYFVESMSNGDTITYRYAGTATLNKGQFETGTHKWNATRGTGKFSGIKASGSCNGKGAADGTVTWSCEGTSELKAAAGKGAAPKKKM